MACFGSALATFLKMSLCTLEVNLPPHPACCKALQGPWSSTPWSLNSWWRPIVWVAHVFANMCRSTSSAARKKKYIYMWLSNIYVSMNRNIIRHNFCVCGSEQKHKNTSAPMCVNVHICMTILSTKVHPSNKSLSTYFRTFWVFAKELSWTRCR